MSTASRADPTDGTTGDMCPQGRYCGSGTGSNQPRCPAGTYNSATGITADLECAACTEGFYCEDMGLVSPTGPCDAGNKTARPQNCH